MTQETVPPSTILIFFSEEAPVYRNSPWVSDYRSDHAPQEHEEQNVKNYKQRNVWSRF